MKNGKDGLIWAVEFRDKEKWHMIATFYHKKTAIASVKCHYLAINDKKQYRVVKYIRKEPA